MGQTTVDTSVIEALFAQEEEEKKNEIERTKPFTGEESVDEGGYFPNPGYDSIRGALFGPDRMETPILEEEKSNPIIIGVVESDEYQNAQSSNARQILINEALNDANMEIFRSKGEPTRFENVRTQQFQDEEGNKETFVVPKPGAESSGFQRGVGGAILNMIQGVGDAVEKGIPIPFTDKRTYGTDDFITDPDTDYFQEEFPTYPAEGGIEKATQDVVPIIVSAIVGAKGVDKLDKLSGVSKKLGNWFSKQYDKAKQIDPSNAPKRLENMIRYFFMERGANLAATIATPDDMEPLIGDDIAEYMGIDPEANKQIGHYIDNEAFTALGSLAIRGAILPTYNFVKNLFPKLSKNPEKRAVEVGFMLLKQIDPNITDDLPGEMIAERARALGETVINNQDFALGILGQRKIVEDGVEKIVDILPGGSIQLDTGTALGLGAREYVEKAYGFLKDQMTPEQYVREIDNLTESIIQNIVGLKQSRRGSTVIQQGEASINRDAMSVLDTAADEAVVGGRANADTAGRELGKETLKPVTDALDARTSATINRELVDETANLVRDRDAILGMLNIAKQNNVLGNTAAETQTLNQLTGPDLFASWERSYKNYNDAFEALPENIPVKMEGDDGLIATIEDLATKTNDFDFITTNVTKQDPFRTMLEGIRARVTGVDEATKSVVKETTEEIAERLSNVDLKFLYTTVRPAISRRLNALEQAGEPVSKELVALKEWIDDAAEASGQPEFRAAMDLYEDHAATYLRTDDLANWEAKAKQVRSFEVAPGVRAGQENLYEMGRQAFSTAEEALTPGMMEAFLNALSKGSEDVSPSLAESYVAMAIAALGKSVTPGSTVTAAQVRDAIDPFIQKLSRSGNNETVQMFEDTVRNLEMVELGQVNAKAAEASAQQAYQEAIQVAQEKAASRFINNLTGKDPSVMVDPSEVFLQIFNSKNAPDLMQELINQGRASGNPLVVDGLKSKYISFIKDRIYTNKRIAAQSTTEGTGATRELSPTQLRGILDAEFDNTLKTLNIVFRDEPQKAESITHLLEVLDVAVNNRAIRGNNFGSTTVLDEKIKEKMNRLIVLTLGVLNPVATKARNISAALLDNRKKDIVEAIELQIDTLLTSPQYFYEVMEAVAKDASGSPLLKAMEKHGIRSLTLLNKERDEQDLERVPPEFIETQNSVAP
tara:strand:- start:2033 stop:5551 length:3519 start_codon:yes stop_codon:yes gene_type:complete